MEEAQELSDRIGIIDHGKLIALDSLPELTRLVGKEDVVELAVTEDGVPEPLVQELGRLPGVRQAEASNGLGQVLAEDGNGVLPEVFIHAGRQDVRFSNVEIKEPNLEAVFLYLTGRALRN